MKQHYKFTCRSSDLYWKDYYGSLQGAKNTATRYYDPQATIEIVHTVTDTYTKLLAPNDTVAVRRNGRWVNTM